MRSFFWIGASLLVSLSCVTYSLPPRPALSAGSEPKGPVVSDFMEVVHGSKGILAQIRDSLSGGGPADDKAWKAVKARAAILCFLTDNVLLRSQPSKGDKSSWKEKVGDYNQTAKDLSRAVLNKDVSGAKSEINKLSKSCKSCHDAHR